MYNFSYEKVGSVDEAAELIRDDDEGKLLAGGQTMLPTMKHRLASPSNLVDLGGIQELKEISSDGDWVIIGAMATHARVAASIEVKEAIPSLAKLAGNIGDPAVRNRGTIGGSIANNDPAADYPAAVIALGATVITNKREIAGDDFFKGMFETALEDDEISAIVLRVNSPGGSALISDEILTQIKLSKKDKPLIVSMGNVAASGGYYISCAADKIFALESTITGSIGVFASSLTENQVIAYIVGIAIVLVVFLMDKLLYFVPASMAGIIQYMSTEFHLSNISRGVIDTRNLIYFGSIIGFFLFMTTRVLESRKWS